MVLEPEERDSLRKEICCHVIEELEDKYESKRLKFEYLSKRLEHTLQFTFTITRLMYLVNGAGLAFLYFALGRDSLLQDEPLIPIILVFTLAALNFLHSSFTKSQHAHYRMDSQYLDEATDVDEAGRNVENVSRSVRYEKIRQDLKFWKLKLYRSSHGNFRVFHAIVCFALTLVGIVLAYKAIFAMDIVPAKAEPVKTVVVTGNNLLVTPIPFPEDGRTSDENAAN